MSYENARCPDPRLLEEVGDLIFHECIANILALKKFILIYRKL
jgi:hypothetical protein